LSKLGRGNISRHVDELINAPGSPEDAFFGKWCLELFKEVVTRLRERGENREIIMSIPLADSKAVRIEYPKNIKRLSRTFEPPSIYLHMQRDFLIQADEEYRKLLVEAPDLVILFRSWRGHEAAAKGWEFSNCVFLWNSVAAADGDQ